MKKKIVIIGAGIAGLSAGIYALRSGFDVTILEQHAIPGGMCTSWRRKGYLFEGGIHWMTGSCAGNPINALWREVGALNDNVVVRFDEPFKSIVWEGKTVCLYRDPQKLEKHFNEVSPEDAEATKRFAADIRAFTKLQMPAGDIKGLKTAVKRKGNTGVMLKMLPLLPRMSRLSKLSVGEYAAQFRHPAIRLLLNNAVSDASAEYSAVSLIITMSTLAAGDGGYPEGGSLGVAKRMADMFTGLGGELLCNTKAERVLIKNGKAVGVSANGKEFKADAVIVTQETLAAAERLFEKPPKDEWLTELRRNTKPAACCFVSLGVKTELAQTPMFMPPEPIRFGDFVYPVLTLNNYSGYSGYAPEGCMSLTAIFFGDSYDFWRKAREEGRYEAEKQDVADQVIRAFCRQYPQCEGKIDITDVATPLTYERYTGSSRGSWMTVMGKGETVAASSPCTLDGADCLFFAGHRVMKPGCMPAALFTGRTAAQMVCRRFGAVFMGG